MLTRRSVLAACVVLTAGTAMAIPQQATASASSENAVVSHAVLAATTASSTLRASTSQTRSNSVNAHVHKALKVHWDACSNYVPKRAKCGHIMTMADPLRPELGKQRVGFEFYPRKDTSSSSLGTLVANEGGPGYPSTESRDYYLEMFGPLMQRRAVLLVDERGTGASDALKCKPLQRGTMGYERAVGVCGQRLGERADTFGTAYAADDMAAVLDALDIDQIDLYGDSYGTFFAQTMALRHPDRVRTLILDASYPLSGQDPWWADTNRAISDAVTRVCDRDPACSARPGDALSRLRNAASELHANPFRGTARDSEGTRKKVTVNGVNLALVTANATYGTTIYKELDAAVRAYHKGLRKPLKRLVAENISDDPDSGSPYYYSAAEYIAVICNDYPALWDVNLPPGSQREAQYHAARKALKLGDPDAFDPFRTDDWIKTGWTEARTCLQWPSPTDLVLPEEPGMDYPDLPTLVLSGDLDSVTSPEGGQDVASRFPDATFVSVPNTGHVTALGDRQGCVEGVVRRFLNSGGTVSGTDCVNTAYAPVRAVDVFARSMARLEPARQGLVVKSSSNDRRLVTAALAVSGDLVPRWWNNYTGDGVGLFGGTYSYTGDDVLRFHVTKYAFVRDVKATGTVVWNRDTGIYTVDLKVDGPGGRDGRITATWNDYDTDAMAKVRGKIHDRRVKLATRAP